MIETTYAVHFRSPNRPTETEILRTADADRAQKFSDLGYKVTASTRRF